jgi:hypothetical protein
MKREGEEREEKMDERRRRGEKRENGTDGGRFSSLSRRVW